MNDKLTNKELEMLGKIVTDLNRIIEEICSNENLYDCQVANDLNSAYHTLRAKYLSTDIFN